MTRRGTIFCVSILASLFNMLCHSAQKTPLESGSEEPTIGAH